MYAVNNCSSTRLPISLQPNLSFKQFTTQAPLYTKNYYTKTVQLSTYVQKNELYIMFINITLAMHYHKARNF